MKSLDWLFINFGVCFWYNVLGDLNMSNIVFLKESFGIIEGVKFVFMYVGLILVIINLEKVKGIVYILE